MAHDIYERMFYSYLKPAWHALAEPSLIAMKAREILDKNFGGGFSIETRPVTVTLNGDAVETGDFALVRTASAFDKQEALFGYCTAKYKPLQPGDICDSFDANVKQPAETMAFLGKGEEMFISWKMPSFEVIPGDVVDLFGIVRCGFDTLKGARLFTSTYRPVCKNTINMAENWAKNNTDGNGRGEIWKGKGVNKNLLRDLGYWMAHVQGQALQEVELLKLFYGNLAKNPIKTDVEAKSIIAEAFPGMNDVSAYYPVQLRNEKQEKIEAFNEGQEQIRDGIYALFAGQGTAITPDYWGMLNSTSEYFCHIMPSKRPVAESIMFGGRQKNIMKMVNTLDAWSR